MKQRLWNLLAIASLLMTIVIIVFWTRSYLAWDRVAADYNQGHRAMLVLMWGSNCGAQYLVFNELRNLHSNRVSRLSWESGGPDRSYESDLRVWGPDASDMTHVNLFFYYSRNAQFAILNNGEQLRSTLLLVPDRWLALATSVLPIIWIWRWRRTSRRAIGHCKNCGYDLRATPDRCPECGKVAREASLSPVPLPPGEVR